MTEQQVNNLRVGDTIYWARIIKSCDISETMEVNVARVGSYIRLVHRKTGQTFILYPSDVEAYCYLTREESEAVTGKRHRKKKVKTDAEILEELVYGDDDVVDEDSEPVEDDD